MRHHSAANKYLIIYNSQLEKFINLIKNNHNETNHPTGLSIRI